MCGVQYTCHYPSPLRMILYDVNILAVVIATFANMIIGMIWYSSSAFGKTWMKLVKLTEADRKKTNMKQSFALGLLGAFLGCYILAVLLTIVHPTTVERALNFGFLLWLGLILPSEISGMAWEQRPMKLMLINGGWSFVSILVTMFILFVWA